MWYDQCGTDQVTLKALNCLYNHPAPVLSDHDGISILEQLCPQMVAANASTTKTCCSSSQLKTFQSNMKLPDETMSRCPSCYKNLVDLYCYMTCSPDQSMYVNASTVIPYKPTEYASSDVEDIPVSTESVSEINYYVYNDTAQGMFNSCQNVNFPSSNTKVMALYCGSYGAIHCTAQRWLDFMGDKNNQQTPFQINFILGDAPETMESMDTTVYSCQEAISNDTQPCSCQDCPASCPPLPPPPPPPKPFLIAGIDGWVFIFSVVYGGFVIFFICWNILCMCFCRSKKQSECFDENSTAVNSVNDESRPLIAENDVGCKAKCGMRFQALLELAFRHLGTAVAGHPFLVLVLGFMVVIVMSCGMVKLQVSRLHICHCMLDLNLLNCRTCYHGIWKKCDLIFSW